MVGENNVAPYASYTCSQTCSLRCAHGSRPAVLTRPIKPDEIIPANIVGHPSQLDINSLFACWEEIELSSVWHMEKRLSCWIGGIFAWRFAHMRQVERPTWCYWKYNNKGRTCKREHKRGRCPQLHHHHHLPGSTNKLHHCLCPLSGCFQLVFYLVRYFCYF